MDQGQRIVRLETKVEIALEGVGNFREFQVEARDFFTTAKVERKVQEGKDKRRARIHYWWLALLSALIVSGFSILLAQFLQLKSDHHISDAPVVTHSDKSTDVAQ